MKKVPELRFPEFSDDWEQKKLEDVTNRFDNLRVPVMEHLRKPGKTPYYGANGILDHVEGFTHNGEYILIAEDGANDIKDYPIIHVNGPVWVNNHAHVLQAKEKISDSKYLAYALKKIDMEPYLFGSLRPKLNAKVLMALQLNMPSLSEQKKIREYLTKIDSFISLYEKQIEDMALYKETLFRKMFPKEGEDVPEIRFQGFSKKWEVCQFADCFQIRPGIQIPAEKQFDEPLDGTEHYVRIVDITQENEPPKYVYPEIKGKVEKEDIVFQRCGTVEKIGYGFQGTLAGNLFKAEPKFPVNSSFFYQQFSNGLFNEQLKKMSIQSSVKSLNFNTLNYFTVYVPEYEEQRKLADFFFGIDKLIKTHKKQLKDMKEYRKGLIQKMF